MSRWYSTREAVKAASGIQGSKADAVIDGYIEAASEAAEQTLGRTFIPVTTTRKYDWPQSKGTGYTLYEPKEDILDVTTLTAGGVAITDYFLEPVNEPPYREIQIDLSGTDSFQSGDTHQQSVLLLGRFGYSEVTKPAGTLVGAINSSVTSLDVSNASLVGVGDTIKIDDEALFVSARAAVDSTADLDANLTESERDVTVTLDTADGLLINEGEVILIGSERMLVTAISGDDLTVERAVDGSVLAAHTAPLDVYVFRTLTVERGVNGTTAAAHDNADVITKYAPPAKIQEWVRAQAILGMKQGESGYTGQIGSEGRVDVNANEVDRLKKECIELYGVVSF